MPHLSIDLPLLLTPPPLLYFLFRTLSLSSLAFSRLRVAVTVLVVVVVFVVAGGGRVPLGGGWQRACCYCG